MNHCPICCNPPVAFVNRVTASGVYETDDDATIYSASRPLFINVLDPVLSLEVSPEYAGVGDVVQYTATLRNGSTLPIVDIILKTLISTYLLPQRASINGVSIPADEVIRGIQLPGIGPGGTAVIRFDVVILPGSSGEITLQSEAVYRYPLIPPYGGSSLCSCIYNRSCVTSNKVTLNVFSPVLEMIQTASQTIVTAGQPNITYTVTVVNRGDFTVSDITVTDPLSPGMTFVPGSVKINGIPQPDASPIDGIDIGSLTVGQRCVVTFQVKLAV